MDSINIQGFIDIELISKKDNIRKVCKNTITNAGKQLLLAKSAGLLLDGNNSFFGKIVASSALTQTLYINNSVNKQSYSDRELTNVLLNIGDERNSLNEDSTFINPWDVNLSEASKLVGYANSNINPIANGKEGSIDYSKGEYIADNSVVCGRWKYPEGVASGVIDTLAMMPANVIKTNQGDGINVGKLLDKVNTGYINYGSMSTSFLIPGVPGYTSNDEVLLNFEQDGCNRWKYNISTGEISQVPDSDNFWVLPVVTGVTAPYRMMDCVVIGNYLYMLGLATLEKYQLYVTVYDISNNMNKLITYQCKQNTTSDVYTNAKFLKIDDNLYVTAWSSGKLGEAANNGKLWKLSKASNYFNAAGTASVNFSSIGFNAPTGVNLAHVGLGNYGDKYVMYIGSHYTSNTGADIEPKMHGYKSMGYVFTDLSNPFGTLVDVISGINPGSVLFSAGNNKGMLRVGFNFYNGNTSQHGNIYDLTDCYKSTVNNDDNSGTNIINCAKTGVIYNPDKSWTNVISFVKLDTPITKTDTDILYVSYGYKVV